MIALYATVWTAMALFAAGELGRSRADPARRPPAWAWWAFAAGLTLAVSHTLLAFAVVHGWSHTDAVRATAVQTAALYGVTFGGGVYINYAFLGVWLADAWWWRASPDVHARPRAVVLTLRAFYLLIIVNAAVVFAVGWRRAAGLAIVAAMFAAWVVPLGSHTRLRSPGDRKASP